MDMSNLIYVVPAVALLAVMFAGVRASGQAEAAPATGKRSVGGGMAFLSYLVLAAFIAAVAAALGFANIFIIYLVPAVAVLALLYASMRAAWVRRQDPGEERMQLIGGWVKQGAMAFLGREYRVLAIFVVAVAVVLGISNAHSAPDTNAFSALSFVLGAICSALAGYFGTRTATSANTRTTSAARHGLNDALQVAFAGGSVMGLSVVGLALLGLGSLFWAYTWAYPDSLNGTRSTMLVLNILSGFSLGASSIALFARVGGGIYTKAADVGADLVGKVEAGIPEDDPRNPAVIADNVGDNVGDCAGMGADLFETYAVTAVGSVFLGYLLPGEHAVTNLVLYPLVLGAIAILASIVGTQVVRLPKSGAIMRALYNGVFMSAGISAVGFLIASYLMFRGFDFSVLDRAGGWGSVFGASVVGIVVTVLIMIITEYYTGTNYSPVQRIAQASTTGSATNIISGLAVGMQSTALPVIVLVLAVFVAWAFAGLYGIGIAAVAMLSVAGMVVAMDTYGPITDNAGGIAEMADLPEDVRAHTDALDAVGNTTKAVTKGYAVGSAALAALVLFADYAERVKLAKPDVFGGGAFRLNDPVVLVGLLIGGMIPFLFSSYLMESVGKAAGHVITEVRRQFREIAGIMEGTAKPEYGKAVDIVTAAALKEMAVPGILAVVAPLLTGLLFGPLAMGGVLIGVIISGLSMALMMANGGGAWDNAKKYIEDGNHGGKGSEAHAASVVGDTVGDPYKDTAGPSINPLIKVINTVSLIFAALIASFGGLFMR